MTAEVISLIVGIEQAGQRLDQFLTTHAPALSRTQVQRLIRDGHVRLSVGHAKPGLVLSAGLLIELTVPPPAPAEPQPEALPLDVLYDDADIVVVNKPAGMVVHPAPGHAAGTLVNALLHHVHGLSGIGGTERPGIVHRLDRGTSGVMIVAKHDRAHRELSRQFHDREVEKLYLALVWGAINAGERMTQSIGRDRRHRHRMSSRSEHAKSASTEIVEVQKFGNVSLARILIGTGRTHQIRVHLSERGHPIVGDVMYGRPSNVARGRLAAALRGLDRPFLHASRLSITHPITGLRLTFEAPLPPELSRVLAAVRNLHED